MYLWQLFSCWVEKWLDNRTYTMSHLIPRLVKPHHEWFVMSSSLHITPSLHHKMAHPVPQLLLNWSFLVSRYFSGKYHVLHITWSLLLCFIIFSLTLCHMSLFLLIIGPIFFPWQCFPFVPAGSFVPMTHFIPSTILPIILTLFDAFVPYCCSIYGSHVCGVLSQPQFSYLSCIG